MEHAGPWRGPGDPYVVLGVSADASQRDIARAYRRAVQHAHPDARPHDPQAAARFQVLTDAYELLGNPDRRADYDRSHPVRQPIGHPPRPGRTAAGPRRSSLPFLLGPPPSQLIWAGPVHVEPPPTATAASSHGRSAPAAELEDPIVILAGRPGQVWGWP
jgi:curved DNA-binding protein CbpA